MKSHFRQAHPGDWARLHPATARLCQAYSTHTMKSQQCPFCHFKVHDRRQHPEQCPVLYQVVSYWLRAHADLQKLQEGHSPATSFFGKKLPAESASQARPTVSAQAQVDTTSSGSPTRRCSTLSNTSNSCYANSVLQAMLVLCWEQFDLGAFGSLMKVLSSDTRKPLNLFGQFEFRHLTAGWRLDGRQHDAAEFLTHLRNHPSGSLTPSQWQARTDGQVEDSDTGLTPLLLPVPDSPSDLQTCMNLWSEHTFQRALCWPPELLPVVLCRWQEGGKSRVPITWQDIVSVSAWQEGQTRSRVSYQVVSGVAQRRGTAFWTLSSFLAIPPHARNINAGLADR